MTRRACLALFAALCGLFRRTPTPAPSHLGFDWGVGESQTVWLFRNGSRLTCGTYQSADEARAVAHYFRQTPDE